VGKVGVSRWEEGKKSGKVAGKAGVARGEAEKKNGQVAGKVGVSRGEEEKETAKSRGRLGFPAGRKKIKNGKVAERAGHGFGGIWVRALPWAFLGHSLSPLLVGVPPALLIGAPWAIRLMDK
jgi:hypothetical protein